MSFILIAKYLFSLDITFSRNWVPVYIKVIGTQA